jgi:hypothetical protein
VRSISTRLETLRFSSWAHPSSPRLTGAGILTESPTSVLVLVAMRRDSHKCIQAVKYYFELFTGEGENAHKRLHGYVRVHLQKN